MLILAGFLESLLHGTVLVALCLTGGSVAWAIAVLRPGQEPSSVDARGLRVLTFGAATLALAQASLLTLKTAMLTDALGGAPLVDFARTEHFRAGAARVALALALVAVARRIPRAPRAGWAAAGALALLLAGVSAWLTHATGRLTLRAPLMTLTVVHQAAAAVWLGGLIQLAAAGRLARRHADVDARWPVLVQRFSRLATGALVVLLASALPLAWTYTGSAQALVGTGYGSLILTKSLLLAAALALGAVNFLTVRGARGAGDAPAFRTRLPRLVEAEAILLVMIAFAAAALSSQPPGVDLPPAARATVAEVAEVFRPKIPALDTPSLATMRLNRAEPATRGDRSPDAYRWSNFSHNVAGLILLGMSIAALAGRRHWPLGFVALAAFIYLRAAANEGAWPFGTTPLHAIDAEGIQHRIAALLVVGLGLLEWRARADGEPRGRLAYVFPVLGAAGGLLLLAHSHAAFELKRSFLVQVTHTTIGAFAAVMVAARWLELGLGPPWRRVAGLAASASMLAIALILVFYQEANVVLPPR